MQTFASCECLYRVHQIQTWNQNIGSEVIDSEVKDDHQEQFIVTAAKISTTKAIEVFNIQSPPNIFYLENALKKLY